jgi:hypothetical protein
MFTYLLVISRFNYPVSVIVVHTLRHDTNIADNVSDSGLQIKAMLTNNADITYCSQMSKLKFQLKEAAISNQDSDENIKNLKEEGQVKAATCEERKNLKNF